VGPYLSLISAMLAGFMPNYRSATVYGQPTSRRCMMLGDAIGGLAKLHVDVAVLR
jgi:hypothetical protein